MIEVYQFGDSPCCMKIRMILAEKELAWEERFVNSWQFDHYQPEYQAMNPLSLVPTLVDDGVPVIQSNVIAEFLEDKYPTPPLKPANPYLASEMREWIAEEQDYLFSLIVTLSFNTMMKTRVAVFGIEQLTKWSKIFPDQEKAQDYLRRVSAPADQDAITAAEKKFLFHMERLEKQLGKHSGPWVCGEQFTLADVCLAGIMDRVEYLDKEHLYNDYPEVSTWFTKLKERPSYRQGVHKFEDRMWGPKKSHTDYPYVENKKFTWGYWRELE